MKKTKIAIVVSRFNQGITQKLLDGALLTLMRNRFSDDQIKTIWVPGAFEIPLAAQKLASTKNYAAILCLGCILKGETDHNQYLSHAVAQGILKVSLSSGIPVAFGVLTPDNLRQAEARSQKNSANKGSEAAEAALEMILTLEGAL